MLSKIKCSLNNFCKYWSQLRESLGIYVICEVENDFTIA